MSEYQFLCGYGHLPRKAAAIAKKHGSQLINYTDPGCSCGRGCRDDCPNNRRHWFTAANHGAPFDGNLADAVETDLKKAGILKEEE
ncbi:MAG: hypothetical protein V2B18_21185 [Pseudomonadota bacterium]